MSSTGNTKIKAKAAFCISLLVILSTTAIVFLSGPKNIHNDALTVSSIISILLFISITIGLYKGISIDDNMPDLSKKISFGQFFDLIPYKKSYSDIDLDAGNGFWGILTGIITWLLLTIVLSVVIAFIIASLWSFILLIVLVLYWIFYRAIRLVFQKSDICKGNLIESLKYGFLYTVLYTIWFHALFFFSRIMRNT